MNKFGGIESVILHLNGNEAKKNICILIIFYNDKNANFFFCVITQISDHDDHNKN